jgi:prevent-host-death family protein
MTDVNVTELRQNLPAYLDKARKGQRIRVTLRGRVIAEISPPAVPADESKAARNLLKGSVLRYDRPLEPASAPEEWDVNR